MKLWLKDNKIVNANNLVCEDDRCPCGGVFVPGFYVVFPFDTVGEPGPSLINSLGNPDWNAVRDWEFDIETKTWVMPPLFECIEGQEANSVYYFGYDDYFYRTSGEPIHETGAKTGAKIHVTPPKLEYFVILDYSQQINDDGDIIKIDMTNRPATAAIYGGGIGVQSDFVYEYDVYNFTQGNTLIGSYKVKITFPSKEWEKQLILEPFTHAIADVVDYPSYPLNDNTQQVNAPITVYDSDDNVIGEDSLWIHILPVSVTGCIPDFDYCVIGSCTYSDNDCSGCLVSSRLMVTQESTAAKLAGDCRKKNSLSMGMASKSYKIIACGFKTQAEAHAYIAANPGIRDALKASCAKKTWSIVGYCECSDEACEECKSKDSLTVKCEDDIKPCSSDKIKTHVLRSGYKISIDAFAYLDENNDALMDDLEAACPSSAQYCRISVTYSCDANGWEKSSAGGTCETIEEPDTAGTWEGADYESATYSIDIEGQCPDDCQAIAEDYDPGEPPYECYSDRCPPGSMAMDFWDGSSCADAQSQFTWRCDDWPGWNFVKWVCREFPQYPPQYRYVVEMCCSHD